MEARPKPGFLSGPSPRPGSEGGGLSEMKETGWISVKERLPEGQWGINFPNLSGEVLIANSCAVLIGYYDRNDGTWYTDRPAKCEWVDKITHWMPLPLNPHN